jgi:hypothetical protein
MGRGVEASWDFRHAMPVVDVASLKRSGNAIPNLEKA